MAATATFESQDSDGTSISSGDAYTFAMTGADASGKTRVVIIGLVGPRTNLDVTAVTIDGQAATRVGVQTLGALAGSDAAMVTAYEAPGTANTTFNVVATCTTEEGQSVFAGYCALWTLDGHDSLIDSTNTAGNDPDLSTDVASGGCAIAAVYGFSDATTTATWTGLTERFDGGSVFGDEVFSGASDSNFGAASTPLAISANISAGMAESVAAICLSWNAAGGGGGTYNAVPLLDHYYRMIGG